MQLREWDLAHGLRHQCSLVLRLLPHLIRRGEPPLLFERWPSSDIREQIEYIWSRRNPFSTSFPKVLHFGRRADDATVLMLFIVVCSFPTRHTSYVKGNTEPVLASMVLGVDFSGWVCILLDRFSPLTPPKLPNSVLGPPIHTGRAYFPTRRLTESLTFILFRCASPV